MHTASHLHTQENKPGVRMTCFLKQSYIVMQRETERERMGKRETERERMGKRKRERERMGKKEREGERMEKRDFILNMIAQPK